MNSSLTESFLFVRGGWASAWVRPRRLAWWCWFVAALTQPWLDLLQQSYPTLTQPSSRRLSQHGHRSCRNLGVFYSWSGAKRLPECGTSSSASQFFCLAGLSGWKPCDLPWTCLHGQWYWSLHSPHGLLLNFVRGCLRIWLSSTILFKLVHRPPQRSYSLAWQISQTDLCCGFDWAFKYQYLSIQHTQWPAGRCVYCGWAFECQYDSIQHLHLALNCSLLRI